jgi:hypothetical protein
VQPVPGGKPSLYPTDAFASGRIAGRLVPCLSAIQQVRFHLGCPPLDKDRNDLGCCCRGTTFAAPTTAPSPNSRTATHLRPTGAPVLKTLRADGPQTTHELVAVLAQQGRAIRPATVETALAGLVASRLAAADEAGQASRWPPLAPSGDPLLDAVDLRGAHDLRHTFATWLEVFLH